jgi:hypothetical protein
VDRYPLTPDNYDEVVSALTGNGVLCTTLSPTGYHIPSDLVTDPAHQTQHFVMAGRRRPGPQHPLVNFGSVFRSLSVNGEVSVPKTWLQEMNPTEGVVISRWEHALLLETTRSFIALTDNAFVADTVLTNTTEETLEVSLAVRYAFGEPDANIVFRETDRGYVASFRVDDHLGDIVFDAECSAGDLRVYEDDGQLAALLTATLAAGESVALSLILHFSDRMGYEYPLSADDLDAVADRHEQAWGEFWSRSEVTTGDDRVDDFRRMSLYTLRCQASPWSIPPTLSSVYWGAGTFHDEMYPFLGLLSSNYPDLAERIPYFRLTTLPQAQARARSRGALYPWSSTEFGEERDPNGHWLTERFHLGQFAVCVWALWLAERDRIQLADLYPILRETARYFEMNMLERDADGQLGTRACTDFDESVGAVKNGPFTLCAAIVCLRYAAEAAEEFGLDADRRDRWRQLSSELRQALFINDGERYEIPGGKPLHYSVVGPTFPFRVDVESARARASAEHIHRVCRSTKGWKPGFSEVFEGSNWVWQAGHLGVVHALQGDAELAWEAIRGGPASAGPFLSPNEHLDREGSVQVPWFTTGCGGWLYALNCLFVQADEEGTILLPAVPAALTDCSFADLRAEQGVLVSGEFRGGRVSILTARASQDMGWRYRVPRELAEDYCFAGTQSGDSNRWRSFEVRLRADEYLSLLDRNSLVGLFRNSPVVGSDLDRTRDQSPPPPPLAI